MERSADRLRHVLREDATSEGEAMDPAPFREQFMSGMDDDLNTPKALAAMFDLSREMNRQRDEGHSISVAQDCLRDLGSLLGLTFEEREAALAVDAESYNALITGIQEQVAETEHKELISLLSKAGATSVETVEAENIDLLITLRAECRNYKQYALADEIRGWLDSQGVSVEDSAAGSIWSYRPTS